MSNEEETKSNRFYNMMYEQQLKYLPKGMTADDLFEHIRNKIKPMRWAGIVHDKDLKPDNKTPKEDHVHVMMHFKNARSLNQVAKDIGDKPQYVEKWNDKLENGYSYLIHATDNSRFQHQYSADEVIANFDYIAEIKRITEKVAKVRSVSSASRTNALLDLIANGKVTLEEAKKQLSGSEYAKADRKLDSAHALYLERCASKLHEEMMANHEVVRVHWLYGSTATGKSLLAKTIAKRLGRYYITATLKDPFQFYEAEEIIILDELRPGVIAFPELLEMFDPYSYGKVRMSPRYHNKTLACRTFFVTSPYDPVGFCNGAITGKNSIDKPEQLYRRLTSVLHLTQDYIHRMEYDSDLHMYVVRDTKDNHYSRKNHVPIIANNLFDEID